MTASKDKLKIELLKQEWEMLSNSIETLLLSVEKCKNIGNKEQYLFEELESFDSLTSKFNCSSDIYTQKVLRTIWMLLHEPFALYIDMMNIAEKMNLIVSADKMIEIRDLRNQIAHEYIPEAITELIPEVIELTASLENSVNKTEDFIRSRHWI